MRFAVKEAYVKGEEHQQAGYESGPVQPRDLNNTEHTNDRVGSVPESKDDHREC